MSPVHSVSHVTGLDHRKAQGNALGDETSQKPVALKGRNIAESGVIRALSEQAAEQDLAL